MYELTVEQQKQKDKVRTGGKVSGGLLAMVVAFMSHFAMLGLEPPVLHWGLVVVLSAGLGYFAYRTTVARGIAKATCKKCGTAFSIRESERNEKLLSAEDRKQVEQLKPASEGEPGIDRVTTWVEERVEITAVDECMHCHDRNTRTWTMTHDKNKVEQEVATPPA